MVLYETMEIHFLHNSCRNNNMVNDFYINKLQLAFFLCGGGLYVTHTHKYIFACFNISEPNELLNPESLSAKLSFGSTGNS